MVRDRGDHPSSCWTLVVGGGDVRHRSDRTLRDARAGLRCSPTDPKGCVHELLKLIGDRRQGCPRCRTPSVNHELQRRPRGSKRPKRFSKQTSHPSSRWRIARTAPDCEPEPTASHCVRVGVNVQPQQRDREMIAATAHALTHDPIEIGPMHQALATAEASDGRERRIDCPVLLQPNLLAWRGRGQATTAMGATRGDDLATGGGRHALTETMRALAGDATGRAESLLHCSFRIVLAGRDASATTGRGTLRAPARSSQLPAWLMNVRYKRLRRANHTARYASSGEPLEFSAFASSETTFPSGKGRVS